MGRPKKEKPNRVNGIYEVKVTIGHDPMGRPIRKSFYSKISKEAAKAKAEQFKVDQAVYDLPEKHRSQMTLLFLRGQKKFWNL